MKKLVIERSRWLRGNKAGNKGAAKDSCLYAPHSKTMCCLGFLARSCGAKVADIYQKADPHSTKETVAWPSKLLDEFGDNSRIAFGLININDDDTMSDAKREKELKQLFKELDIDVVFK